MQYNDVQRLTGVALEKFKSCFGVDYSSIVQLLSRQDIKSYRSDLINKLGATFEPYLNGIEGETIWGTNGTLIVIYPHAIIDEKELLHVVCHECGHKLFADRNPELRKKQFFGEYSVRKRMAYTLLDEFIAESLSNFAVDPELDMDPHDKQNELVGRLLEAFPGINTDKTMMALKQNELYRQGFKFLPAVFGIYCGMLLTDPTLIKLMQDNPMYERGFAYCSKNIIEGVQDVIEWLMRYINSTSDYTITEEELDDLGKLTIRLCNMR